MYMQKKNRTHGVLSSNFNGRCMNMKKGINGFFASKNICLNICALSLFNFLFSGLIFKNIRLWSTDIFIFTKNFDLFKIITN